MNSLDDLFDTVKMLCSKKLQSDTTFKVFVDPTRALSLTEDRVVLEAPSVFLRDYLRGERYMTLFADAFREVLGHEIEIEIKAAGEGETPAAPAPAVPLSSFGEAFTFDTFVEGTSNRFARAAAMAVASDPARKWNPLFIYGNSGLGKTHLLGAISNEIARTHPDYKIVYVDGEVFTNEIIAAIRGGSTEEMRRKYRQADLLLVDDIQFIAGKESTQEEFFHTFNSLHGAGKQIVLASDRTPKEMKSLEDRLRTRFESGLIADIQPPDYETRAAILRRKAENLALDVPEAVLEYIAGKLEKGNVRQLEGTVKKMAAMHTIEGVRPSLGVAQKAIEDIMSESQPMPVTVDKIISEVARTFSVEVEDIRSAKQSGPVSRARKLCMYIIRETTGMSHTEIGDEFARDHSTVTYALKSVEKSLQTDTALRERVGDIIKNING